MILLLLSKRNPGTGMSSLSAIILLLLVVAPRLPTSQAAPVNDLFAEPSELSGALFEWEGELTGASWETGEEEMVYDASVWGRWTAPVSGQFRAIDSNYRPNIAVFKGDSLNSIEEVSSFITFGAIFYAEAGTTYKIRVAKPGIVADAFRVRLSPVAPNESPGDAIELTGTNINLTTQNWTLNVYSRPLGEQSGLWYKWIAPGDGSLTYTIDSNTFNQFFTFYHQNFPTIDSNVFEPFSYSRRNLRSGTMAVTEGVTYLIAVRSWPTTNLTFHLRFQPMQTNLDSLSNILFGGDVVPVLQTTNFNSPPSALQFKGIARDKHAWFEMVFPGPGTLSFRTKLAQSGSQRISFTGTNWNNTISLNTSADNWLVRSFYLGRATNVVRWTIINFFDGPPSMTAWFDDIQFVPDPRLTPGIQLYRYSADSPMQLNLQMQAGRTTAVETSSNLVDWMHWTNIYSPRTTYGYQLPIPPDESALFFRLRSVD